MTATIRNSLAVFLGAATVMLAVTTTPVHAMGEGFGKFALNRHLAEYWAQRHAQHARAEVSLRETERDDRAAKMEAPAKVLPAKQVEANPVQLRDGM